MARMAQAIGRTNRVMRRPQHVFQLRQYPYTIQPFMLAPVIPGETMKNLLLQARVVTDPVAHPLTGWWVEYYFFYVKHRDLNIRDDLEQMVLDVEWNDAGVVEAEANPSHYFAGGGIDWTAHCLERVTEVYFRNESEAWDAFTLHGLPVASVVGNNWMDSLVRHADYVGPSDVAIPLDATAETVQASDIEVGMRQWELARLMNLTDMDYADFLATYGIKARREELHEPELLRFVRQWSYPSNTIDPEDGSPSSAVSWSIAERADKDRMFREPGFVFGVTVARPKVYFSKQTGSAAILMNNAFTWLPATLADDPATSIIAVDEGQGPLPGILDTNDLYVVDVKDLLIYGDQFLNFAPEDEGSPVANRSLLPLPQPTAQWRYPENTAWVDALFAGAGKHVWQDGIVSLAVAGAQVDQFPGVRAQL